MNCRSPPDAVVIDSSPFIWREASSEMPQYIFEMGMTCGGCANAARKVLGKLGEDKLKIDDINVETKLITVTTNLPAEDVIEQLKKTGKEIKQVQ